MRFWRSHWAIISVLCLALFLRAYKVDVNPPALSWDEASIGYNAYSILKTGKDEHGTFLPLDAFAAFGDYKPVLPIYVTVPFVGLFGLTELAVRLPSVIAATLTVGMLYLLVLALFGSSKSSKSLGLISALLLTITPWHIMLSRAGFEANIALLFLIVGLWLVIKSKEHPTLLYICWLPFVAGVYTFNSARYAGPLIAMGVGWYMRKTLLAHRKYLIWGIVVACFALIPILPHLISKESRLRFEEVSIFTDLRTVLTSNLRREVDGVTDVSGLVHNRRIGYAREYLIHFFDHFEPRYLFVRGDGNPKFSIQDTGQLLIVSAPFLVYGIGMLFLRFPAITGLLVWWLLVSIVPAAVARETPHALRTENTLPVWLIFTGFGIAMVIERLAAYKKKVFFTAILVAAFTLNFAYFWHNLMIHYPKEYSGEWQYGYKNAIQLAIDVRDQYDTIVLTESIGRPYIYALFYEQYDPERFWKTRDASFDAAGFYNVYGFDTYRFTQLGVGSYPGKVLYILSPKDVPTNARIVETIRLLNGNPVLVAFE